MLVTPCHEVSLSSREVDALAEALCISMEWACIKGEISVPSDREPVSAVEEIGRPSTPSGSWQ